MPGSGMAIQDQIEMLLQPKYRKVRIAFTFKSKADELDHRMRQLKMFAEQS